MSVGVALGGWPGASSVMPAWAGGDGRALFVAHCATCHAIACNRVGPRLAGVIGRPAGSVLDFDGYSTELRFAGIVWDAAQLDRLLADPAALVHRSWMEALVPIAAPTERRRLIAWLASGDRTADDCP